MTTLSLEPGSLIVEIRRLLESRTLLLFSPSELPLPAPRTNNGTSPIDQKTNSFSNRAMVLLFASPLSNLEPGTD